LGWRRAKTVEGGRCWDATGRTGWGRLGCLSSTVLPARDWRDREQSECIGGGVDAMSFAGRKARGWGGREGTRSKAHDGRGVCGLGAAEAKTRGHDNGRDGAGAAARGERYRGLWVARYAGIVAGTDEWCAGKANVRRAEGALIRRHERDQVAAAGSGLGWGSADGRVGAVSLVAGNSNAAIRAPCRSRCSGRVEEVGFDEGNNSAAIRAPCRSR